MARQPSCVPPQQASPVVISPPPPPAAAPRFLPQGKRLVENFAGIKDLVRARYGNLVDVQLLKCCKKKLTMREQVDMRPGEPRCGRLAAGACGVGAEVPAPWRSLRVAGRCCTCPQLPLLPAGPPAHVAHPPRRLLHRLS